MSRLLGAVALVILLLAPGVAQAQEKPLPDPEYPEHVSALLPGFFEDAQALVKEGDEERPWWPRANAWLANATNASEAGRFRLAMLDLETFAELVLTGQLMDEAAQLPNDAERKQFIIQRTTGWRQDADTAWNAYRAKLHGYDGQMRSLQTIETAMYSADIAAHAMLATTSHALYARELPNQPGFLEGDVHALVLRSHTPLMKVRWAEDILQAAADLEGTGARVNEDAFGNLTTAALSLNGTPPAYLEALRTLGQPARANGEGTLALTLVLAEQRAARLNDIQLIYGDAQSRTNVVSDAGKFLRRRLENVSMESPREVGLSGVFTADALDQGLYAVEFHERGAATLAHLLETWASNDHAGYVRDTLALASPVTPPPADDGKDAPLAPWLALVGVVAVALALRRRR